MKFTVLWAPIAEAALLEIWTESADRQAVTDAVAELDRYLAFTSLNVGESREDD